MELSYISLLLLCFFLLQTSAKKSYIVYLGSHSFGSNPIFDVQLATQSQYDILGSVMGSKMTAKESMIYTYNRHINGFAAVLDENEVMAIAQNPNVVSVFENKKRQLHTTRTWGFLGLENDAGVPSNSIWKAARFGEDIIIGNLDTGVWPESKSFSDAGYGPVPSRWMGVCEGGFNFTCNKKLIGARYFYKGFEAANGPIDDSVKFARDLEGHGSHTLSTAGGNFVPGANVFGNGNGTAKGGSPKARVAAYKVCWPALTGGCFDADILAAFEAAISDGVDVLSVSLGSPAQDFASDPVAIGAFHAVQEGITVVCSAGNDGPSPSTVTNVAPWMFTVAASTVDRDFFSYVTLGNKKQFKGLSLSAGGTPGGNFYPLMDGVQVKAANITDNLAQLCEEGSLDPTKAKGKIILCLRGDNARLDKGVEVLRVGGVGMILVNDKLDGNDVSADRHFLPASHLNYTDGLEIFQYLNSTQSPVASISHVETELGIKPSPMMGDFSSRGPNPIIDSMIKPDITAPGLNIIAAVSESATATSSAYDTRRVPFNFEIGTSMSCPHISGVVGLLKTLYPKWSPAAIRSAIMTTAKTRDNSKKSILDYNKMKATPFHYGAGHVHPNNAMDPGLVYDTTTEDYMNFLCALGYNYTTLREFYNKPYVCPESFAVMDLNYPSISVPKLTAGVPVTINRKVKNVGSPGTYVARVKVSSMVSVTVEPSTLQFDSEGEEKAFKVVFQYKGTGQGKDHVFGTLIWSDGKHFVRSPMAMALA
ncbi:subtilisin-like protease SBT5.4 [Benincasa hispida]|uniref:subtilisin-like protease SBT5.4 n=1 Tax=Benincasa hispida TaxID=102211 RepID=UPI0019011119|nr:subtilisin-like protease SBT5.4 [Benincasa hispida]